MSGETYYVQTDLNPEELTILAAATYALWVSFALGKSVPGLRILQNPSGRYAASMSWKKTGESSIAIIADENVAPEAGWIETGHVATNMKDKMLGQGNTRVSKAGYRYRVIPMRATQVTPSFDVSKIIQNKKGGHLPSKAGKMWVKAYSNIGSNRFATMTDKPGSSNWIIPAMPAYSPAAILADQLRKQYSGSGGSGVGS